MRYNLQKHAAALALVAAVLAVTSAEPAAAQTANIEAVLQNIVDMLTGNCRAALNAATAGAGGSSA